MSQVLANPESSSPPKNNYPLKVDTSKLISLSAKISDIIDTLNKCHTDPRFINNDYLTFLFATLNVQDIHYLFSKIIFLHIFGYFLKCPCGVHVFDLYEESKIFYSPNWAKVRRQGPPGSARAQPCKCRYSVYRIKLIVPLCYRKTCIFLMPEEFPKKITINHSE